MYNYAASGDGNDICLDDFVLNACLPTVEIVGESEGKLLPGDARIECGKSLDMNVAFGGSESTYFDTRRGPYYLWQYSH